MNNEKKIIILQQAYAGALADSVRQFDTAVLEQITARKKQEQLKSGGFVAAQLGINKPEDVFTRLTEIFNCANWTVISHENGFTAETTDCMLVAIAKRTEAPCPCSIYCLNPMEGMIKGLEPNAQYNVRETLWSGKRRRVEAGV